MKGRLFIFGAGAHARKVYHYAVDAGWTVAAFVDESAQAFAPVDGVELLRAARLTPPSSGDAIFVAIGEGAARRRLVERLAAGGWDLPALVHRSAWVAPDAVIADAVLVAAGAVVETRVVVGRGAIIDVGAVLDHDCRVAEFVHVRAGEVLGPGESVSSGSGSRP